MSQFCCSVAKVQFRTSVQTLNIRTEHEVQFRFIFGSAKYTWFSSTSNSSQKNPNAELAKHWGYFYWQNQGKILHCRYGHDGCLHPVVPWLPCGYLTPPHSTITDHDNSSKSRPIVLVLVWQHFNNMFFPLFHVIAGTSRPDVALLSLYLIHPTQILSSNSTSISEMRHLSRTRFVLEYIISYPYFCKIHIFTV